VNIDNFIKGFNYESDEARIDNLFKSIKTYLNEIHDVNSRIASIHLLIRKLRDLSNEYTK
jgi:N-methylhydantoinase B/oxoprolinase/acetone carboxylase alpha subunit